MYFVMVAVVSLPLTLLLGTLAADLILRARQ